MPARTVSQSQPLLRRSLRTAVSLGFPLPESFSHAGQTYVLTAVTLSDESASYWCADSADQITFGWADILEIASQC